MPRIFDNIEQQLLPALQEALQLSAHADFYVGYFNLRGWKQFDKYIEQWSGGDGNCCRLLAGMQKPPHEQLRQFYSLLPQDNTISNQVIIHLKKKLAEDFEINLLLVHQPMKTKQAFAALAGRKEAEPPPTPNRRQILRTT